MIPKLVRNSLSKCLRVIEKNVSKTTNQTRTFSDHGEVEYDIRLMKRSDIDPLYRLLAENNWNMEKSYLECVFNTDPTGLVVVVTKDGELIGHNGILSHSDLIASSGMNIVKSNYRSLGVGRQLFRKVMEVMAERNVGGTSLSNRVTFYNQFGWTIKSYTFHYNQGQVDENFISERPEVDCDIVPADDINFNDVISYDAEIHTVPRAVYIANWAQNKIAKTYVAVKGGQVYGYGTVRPADVGYKIYPLYADSPSIAKALFCRLVDHVPHGQEIIFTQPIENENANAFVSGNKLKTYLSMTRLYNKWDVKTDISRVYSVASTEYGIV